MEEKEWGTVNGKEVQFYKWPLYQWVQQQQHDGNVTLLSGSDNLMNDFLHEFLDGNITPRSTSLTMQLPPHLTIGGHQGECLNFFATIHVPSLTKQSRRTTTAATLSMGCTHLKKMRDLSL